MAILVTGFFALMSLGELCFPNDIKLRNWKKISKRSSILLNDEQYKFHLPFHKADCFFEGNQVIVKKKQFCDINSLAIFCHYLTSCDNQFPLLSHLWLNAQGSIPNQTFFMSRMHHYFDHNIASQSMRAGGATSLAENSVPPSLIQMMGHWSLDTFLIYIQKNPMPIQALLF
jgi:hypothetical protein